jgi:thiosulfate reductase cytochrome b subunit
MAATVRHALLVRVTHGITALCFAALLVTGAEIIISHPRFYWGETGNVNTPSLFDIPIPASRPWVQTGYNFLMPDQNGWSRSLHFQMAWLLVFTAVVYGCWAFRKGHFQGMARVYNPAQRRTYWLVVFLLFPLMIWTGLAMSPGFVAAFPFLVDAVGGHQSARTIHFFATLALVVFVLGHIAMVVRTGFRHNVRAITMGGSNEPA